MNSATFVRIILFTCRNLKCILFTWYSCTKV